MYHSEASFSDYGKCAPSVHDGKNVQSVIFNASTFISQNLFFGTTVFKIYEMPGIIIQFRAII